MKLVFLLEEKSMKYFIDGIMTKILPPEISFVTIPHEGKSDLQKSIPRKLRGWREPDVKFVIVQDQDSNDCRELKQKLIALCGDDKHEKLIRIACHELEAWYFGDLDAVSKAYKKDLSIVKRKRAFRNPDSIISPKKELKKIIPEHQQISGAQKISEYIDINRNTSPSFHAFVSGIQRLIS